METGIVLCAIVCCLWCVYSIFDCTDIIKLVWSISSPPCHVPCGFWSLGCKPSYMGFQRDSIFRILFHHTFSKIWFWCTKKMYQSLWPCIVEVRFALGCVSSIVFLWTMTSAKFCCFDELRKKGVGVLNGASLSNTCVVFNIYFFIYVFYCVLFKPSWSNELLHLLSLATAALLIGVRREFEGVGGWQLELFFFLLLLFRFILMLETLLIGTCGGKWWENLQWKSSLILF